MIAWVYVAVRVMCVWCVVWFSLSLVIDAAAHPPSLLQNTENVNFKELKTLAESCGKLDATKDDVFVRGDVLCFSGSTNQDSTQKVLDILHKTHIRYLVIDSVGGDANSAIDMAKALNQEKVDIYVHGVCMSSCYNFIFVSGIRKYIPRHSSLWAHGDRKSVLLSFHEAVSRLETSSKDEERLAGKIILLAIESYNSLEKKEEDFYKSLGVSASIGSPPDSLRCTLNNDFDKDNILYYSGYLDLINSRSFLKENEVNNVFYEEESNDANIIFGNLNPESRELIDSVAGDNVYYLKIGDTCLNSTPYSAYPGLYIFWNLSKSELQSAASGVRGYTVTYSRSPHGVSLYIQ